MFSRYASKPNSVKINVVRGALLPFLRTYANHPSNYRLRPDDLDRRTGILDKWWVGLLEQLVGSNLYNVSANDRPILLDAVSGIMQRPEWRSPPSAFCPLSDRMPSTTITRNSSKSSLASNTSEYLLESVHHSIRNMFVQNLLVQMAFAVDRMSLRSAPASLVSFCGKTCAYAFFFCPCIADILVRLWDIPTKCIKRVLSASNPDLVRDIRSTPRGIQANFPQCLQGLALKSSREAVEYLRKKPITPLGTEHIQWHGYWLSRWSGKESDLFYVFVKYFHILTAEFLSSDADKIERLSASGVVLVHSQLLANLDSTIHRQGPAVPDANATEGTQMPFDDFLGADATAPSFTTPPANATRPMTENRLIVLLRDMLADSPHPPPVYSVFFSESFCDILKASVRTTSLYHHSACFILCDFLQETFAILANFQRHARLQTPLINITFWMPAFKQMVQSQNTTTEIRLYSLLFTCWPYLTDTDVFKTELSINFLLEEQYFTSRFCHWCPMVRAYFMRLVCWRVARCCHGEVTDVDQ